MQEISQTVKCLNKHNEVIHNTNHPSKSKPISSWTEQKSLHHDNSYLISLLLRNKAYMHQASANFDRFDLRVANSKKKTKLNETRLATTCGGGSGQRFGCSYGTVLRYICAAAAVLPVPAAAPLLLHVNLHRLNSIYRNYSYG